MPWLNSVITPLIFCFTLISQETCLLQRLPDPAMQRHDLSKRKAVQSNAETLNYLELAVHLVSKPTGSTRNLIYYSAPYEFTSQLWGALAHSLGTTGIKVGLMGMAWKFQLISVFSTAVLPSLLPLLCLNLDWGADLSGTLGPFKRWLMPPFCWRSRKLNLVILW